MELLPGASPVAGPSGPEVDPVLAVSDVDVAGMRAEKDGNAPDGHRVRDSLGREVRAVVEVDPGCCRCAWAGKARCSTVSVVVSTTRSPPVRPAQDVDGRKLVRPVHEVAEKPVPPHFRARSPGRCGRSGTALAGVVVGVAALGVGEADVFGRRRVGVVVYFESAPLTYCAPTVGTPPTGPASRSAWRAPRHTAVRRRAGWSGSAAAWAADRDADDRHGARAIAPRRTRRSPSSVRARLRSSLPCRSPF